MSENTVVQLQRVVIKEELYVLTGDHLAAALLNNLIFWQGIVDQQDKQIQSRIALMEGKKGQEKRIESLKKKLRFGWFYKTGEELLNEMMGWGSPATMTRRIKEFIDQGWMEKGNNPDPRKKWDRTKWYRVKLDKIAADLHEMGYALEGYSLLQKEADEAAVEGEKELESAEQCIFHGEICILHGEKCNFHGEKSIFHGERTIPESNHQKVTSESNSIKNLSILESIKALDLPSAIISLLEKKIDRLMLHQIDLNEIEILFHQNRELIGHADFISILNDVLMAEKYNYGFKRYMAASIKNYLTNREDKGKAAGQPAKPVRKEELPDWLEKRKQQEVQQQDLDQDEDMDFEAEKKKLEEELKKFKNK